MPRLIPAVLLALALVPAIAQSLGDVARKNREEREAKKSQPHRVLTNDDFSSEEQKSLPPAIPGLLACNKEMKCFVEAIGRGTPAWVIHTETAPEASAMLTMSTTWWIAKFDGDRCAVSLKVNAFSGVIDEERAKARRPDERPRVVAWLDGLTADFAKIRGLENTCVVTRSALIKALTSNSLSVTMLGLAANKGDDCTGPLFDATHSPERTKK